MPYASFVALLRSSDAPVVMLPQNSFSAARPPISCTSISRISSWLYSGISFGRFCVKPSAPLLRGTIVTFSIGSTCSLSQPMIAWPASWYAMRRFSSCVIRSFFFSIPHSTRSTAAMMSNSSTFSCLRRIAMIAASFTMLQMSAPV